MQQCREASLVSGRTRTLSRGSQITTISAIMTIPLLEK